MSWEANHIYAPAYPTLIDNFCWADALTQAVYLIRHFRYDAWPAGVESYDVDSPGLLVVREVQAGERRLIRWTEDRVVSWRSLEGPPELDVITAASLGDTYLSHLTAPPTAFLRFLKDVSQRADYPVAFYHRDVSDDQIEEEFAWVFGGEDAVFVQNGDTTVAVHTATSREIISGSVLSLALRHCGIKVPPTATRPYFPPHSPTFAWADYRYNCAGR